MTGGTGTRKVSSGAVWEPVVGYSRAVAAGDFVFVSGCTSIDGAEFVHPGDAYAQTAQAIANVESALAALAAYSGRVSKEEILHAIRSNSHMTEKVLEFLVAEGFVRVLRDDRGYDIRITSKGVEHLRQYHRLYRELYARELAEHYRYTGSPEWLG